MEDMLLQKRVCTVGKMTVKQPLYVRGKQHKITDPDHDRDYNAVDVNQTKFESSIFEGLSRYGFMVWRSDQNRTVYVVDKTDTIDDLHFTLVKAR